MSGEQIPSCGSGTHCYLHEAKEQPTVVLLQALFGIKAK